MKLIAFNGSPRKNGNTAKAIEIVFEELERNGIQTELVQLGGANIHGCRACRLCIQRKNNLCAQDDDDLNLCIKKMLEAQGIIIGSPVYIGNITPEVAALINRVGYVAKYNDSMLKRKVGAAVITMRSRGGVAAYSSILYFFSLSEMIILGCTYWGIGLGGTDTGIINEQEFYDIYHNLGSNIAWLLRSIYK